MFQMDERDKSWTAAIGQKQLSGHKRPFPSGGFRPEADCGQLPVQPHTLFSLNTIF